VLVAVVLLQAGNIRNEALTTNKASSPHAVRERFPPAAAPTATNPSKGRGSHSA